jgi:hypothetical protein
MSVCLPSSIPMFQSTHPRGVRLLIIFCWCLDASFNPRTRGGCDITDDLGTAIGIWFQSTHPRGVRQLRMLSLVSIRSCFNPRTRGGCDLSPFAQLPQVVMFQSTHPRGVRQDTSWTMMHFQRFQSTHPRGVRPHRSARPRAWTPVSIHAPAGGATR